MLDTDSRYFTIGTPAECTDGPCGELRRVVVDPVARRLTHLVVGPADDSEPARLVPVELAEAAEGGDRITLRCSLEHFQALQAAQETRFLPGAEGTWDYSQEQLLSWPYYGLGLGSALLGGEGAAAAGYAAINAGPAPVEVERVPVGEVQVHRGEPVHAKDGEIGRVQGLVVDPRDHAVTHVLLDEGHLFARARVAIPVKFLVSVVDGVHVDLTKEEVRDLPEVNLEGED